MAGLRTLQTLTVDDRELIARQRYLYGWTLEQIGAWWLEQCYLLHEHQLEDLLAEPPASIVAEVDERRVAATERDAALRSRAWRADRASLEAMLGLIGPAAVRASEARDARELRQLAEAYAKVATVAREMPDDRRGEGVVVSDVLELSEDEIAARWRDLV